MPPLKRKHIWIVERMPSACPHFLGPDFNPGGKIPWSRRQLSSSPGIRWSEEENDTLRFWGPWSSLRCTQRPESDLPPAPLHPTGPGSWSRRGFKLWGGELGRSHRKEQKDRQRQTAPRTSPESQLGLWGTPSPLPLLCKNHLQESPSV